MNKTDEIIVKCPECKRSFKYYTSDTRPFCSDKCKLIDLGQWLNESFVINGRSNTVYIEEPESVMMDEDE